jgi:hypothetical protein
MNKIIRMLDRHEESVSRWNGHDEQWDSVLETRNELLRFILKTIEDTRRGG